MSILEFPEAIAKAIASVGGFFDKIYWLFVTIGWALTFVFYVAGFFALQIIFIYSYYKLFQIVLGLKPKVDQLLKRVDTIFQ